MEKFENIGPVVTDRQTVKVKLTSRHMVHDMERFAKYGNFMTMFDPEPRVKSGKIEPEDYPDEMNDALNEILDRENGVIGYPTEEELLDYCSDEVEDEPAFPEMDTFENKLEMFLKLFHCVNFFDHCDLLFLNWRSQPRSFYQKNFHLKEMVMIMKF